MKKVINGVVVTASLTAAALLFVGCDFFHQSPTKSATAASEAQTETEMPPVTISKSGTDAEITGFQSNVKVYEENNRSPYGRQLVEEYRLSLKIIDGALYTRMDFKPDEEVICRSIIHSPQEVCVFDTATERVEYRTNAQNMDETDSEFRTLFGRADLNDIQDYFSGLSFRITEEAEEKRLRIETPSEYLDGTIGGARLVSEVLYFDTELAVPVGSEYTSIDDKGTTVNTEETVIYQMSDGVPIKTGEVIVTKHDFPYTIDTSDREIPILTATSDPAAITENELASLEEQGALVFSGEPVIGNPADPDYTVTTIVRYEDVELNGVADSYLRPNL